MMTISMTHTIFEGRVDRPQFTRKLTEEAASFRISVAAIEAALIPQWPPSHSTQLKIDQSKV